MTPFNYILKEHITAITFLYGLDVFNDISSDWDLSKGKRKSIYFLIKDEEIVYVGQSIMPLQRIEKHSRNKVFDSYYLMDFDSYEELKNITLNDCERILINRFLPKYNVDGITLRIKYDKGMDVLDSFKPPK